MERANRPAHTLTRRLIVFVVLFSSLITVIGTAVQLYREYNRDLDLIGRRFEQLRSSYLPSIVSAAWVTDYAQLGILLDGIRELPDMEYAAVHADGEGPIVRGAPQDKHAITRRFDLTYLHRGSIQRIGQLTVTASLYGVYWRLVDRTLVILLSNALKTFLVAIFIYFVVTRLIMRHLGRIAEFARGIRVNHLNETLTLDRASGPHARPDELDDVALAFNEMRENLKSSSAELVESEQRFRDVVEVAADWFWEMDEDLRLSHVSDRLTAFTGIDADDLLGKTRTEITLEDTDNEKWRRHLDDLEARRPFRNFSHEMSGSEGRRIQVRLSGKPIFDADGAFKGYRGAITDITREVEAEEAAALAEEQLRQAQKMEAVGQLTGGVAHDFNNLLGVVMGNLELVDHLADGDARMLEATGRSMAAAKRGASLVQRLLAFSRRQALKPEVVDLNGLVGDMTELLGRTLGEPLEIQVVGADGAAVCEVDRTQIENALLNLAINARDAMPEGGTLTIETASERLEGEDAVRAGLAPGEHAVMSVSDTGVGMSPGVLERVFDPFFTTKGVGKGTGLGLSMVYGFVRQSRGNVKIFSKEGEGTTVKIYLPRSGKKVASALEFQNEAPETGGETILVLEDDPSMRELAVNLVESLGYRVVEAGTGAEALTVLDATPDVELLLSDVILPGGLNGPQVANEARIRRSGIKVLFMSGYSEDYLSLNSGEQVPLLKKPFTREDLAGELRKLLDGGEG